MPGLRAARWRLERMFSDNGNEFRGPDFRCMRHRLQMEHARGVSADQRTRRGAAQDNPGRVPASGVYAPPLSRLHRPAESSASRAWKDSLRRLRPHAIPYQGVAVYLEALAADPPAPGDRRGLVARRRKPRNRVEVFKSGEALNRQRAPALTLATLGRL